MTRHSVEYRPTNEWVISCQLDEKSSERLRELCYQTGFNKSKMIKILIMGARVKVTQQVSENARQKLAGHSGENT
jgi:hypothetical protein